MMKVSLSALIICMICQFAVGQSSGLIPIAKPGANPSGRGFDLGRLFVGSSGQPVWSMIDKNLPQVQQMIDETKANCIKKLGMKSPQRSLIREIRPTPQEKCLVDCVLKGIKIMDTDTNRLNLRRVEELTSLVTEDNKMAIALGCSLAQICNRSVTSKKPCEVAHQLNQCIGRQLERNKVKLHW